MFEQCSRRGYLMLVLDHQVDIAVWPERAATINRACKGRSFQHRHGYALRAKRLDEPRKLHVDPYDRSKREALGYLQRARGRRGQRECLAGSRVTDVCCHAMARSQNS